MPTIADLETRLGELAQAPNPEVLLGGFRAESLKALAKKTGRNVIAYYSSFMTRHEKGDDITDLDLNAFMNVVHGMDRGKGLDLVLHTPGGGITATEQLVHYLRDIFQGDIRCIVPQAAFSAGTMIACAAREILMGRQSCLGPIDPQYLGVPCHGVVEEFESAAEQIRKDPAYLSVWRPIIEKYRPTFLGECQKAIKLSNELVREWLKTGMFASDPKRVAKATKITATLGSHSYTKTHDRHIPANEVIRLGLKVTMFENDQELQELILTVHHCFILSFQHLKLLKVVLGDNGRQFMTRG